MNDTTIWNLSYSNDTLKHVRNKIIEDMSEINNVMKKVYSNNCIIVTITPSDHNGLINHTTDIHIFDNFLDANPLLNQEQREEDVNVTVMQYNLKHDKFLFILLKQHNTRNYKRISKRSSENMFNKFALESRIQFLYDEKETKVIIHKPL